MKGFSVFKRSCLFVTVLMLFVPLSEAMAKQHGYHKAKTKKAMVRVMTRNLYLGADIFKVVTAATNPDAGPLDVPMAVAEIFQTMQYTNFPERAKAIADEINAAKPDVIGLQEVETYYLQSPGDMAYGGTVAATQVFIDFLDVLEHELKARGLRYDAFSITNADVELPMLTGFNGSAPTFDDVRMVDRDVILVKRNHHAGDVLADNYSDNLILQLGRASVEFTRGYLAVDVCIKGVVYRCVNTHLEVRSAPDSVFRVIQSAQISELIGILDDLALEDARPVIMVGDFNSSIEDVPGYGLHPSEGWLPYIPPYQQIVDAGYLDTWLLQKRYGDGFTSGFEETIDNPEDNLETRIDLIFVDPWKLGIDKVRAKVVGDDVTDMTPSGFWPSDHAGVVTTIKFIHPRRPGHRGHH